MAASVDGVGDASGVGGDAGEAGVLDVGAVLVDLGVAVLRVHHEHAADAEAAARRMFYCSRYTMRFSLHPIYLHEASSRSLIFD